MILPFNKRILSPCSVSSTQVRQSSLAEDRQHGSPMGVSSSFCLRQSLVLSNPQAPPPCSTFQEKAPLPVHLSRTKAMGSSLTALFLLDPRSCWFYGQNSSCLQPPPTGTRLSPGSKLPALAWVIPRAFLKIKSMLSVSEPASRCSPYKAQVIFYTGGSRHAIALLKALHRLSSHRS